MVIAKKLRPDRGPIQIPIFNLINTRQQYAGINTMVRKGGFEPPRLSAPPPQDGVSASSTTSALKSISYARRLIRGRYRFAVQTRRSQHRASYVFIHGQTRRFKLSGPQVCATVHDAFIVRCSLTSSLYEWSRLLLVAHVGTGRLPFRF